tara:strand:- start:26047 stop:27957 length:1911 start_codon:yes stop_codon:yes gene_type:complete
MAHTVSYIVADDAALAALTELENFPKVCLDLETTGLDARIARPRLVQLCDSSPQAESRVVYVFDLFKVSEDVTSKLLALIESREMLIGHNLYFDLQFLLAMGLDYKGKIFCTMIAERCLRAGFKEKKFSPKIQKAYFADISNSLKAVAERRLDLELDKSQQVSDWSKEELDTEQVEYAAGDVAILPQIASLQLAELTEENLLPVFGLESKIISTVAKMSYTGFNVDVTKLKALEARIKQELDELTTLFCEDLDRRLPDESKLSRDISGAISVSKNARKGFNPGSGAQVLKCFDAIGIETPRSITSGKPTLSQVELAEFNSQDETLLLYRKRTKVETKLGHVQKLLDNIHPLSGRIHSGYRQYGSNSGRFTSSGSKRVAASKVKSEFAINCQQVPREKAFRECFVATPGFKLVVCDFSQIELRLGAELIPIPQMLNAFLDGKDLHTVTASLIYQCDFNEVTKEQRQSGKTMNFALLYGMGYKKYRTYSAQSGTVLSYSEAKLEHAAFHRAYPALKSWHKNMADLVSDGWTYSRTATGRRRLLSYDDASMMVACNNIIQGAGADILKIALSYLVEHLNDECRLIACVHDEIVIEAKEHKVDHYRAILEDCMKRGGEKILKEVPVLADAATGNNWAEAK